MKQSILAAFLIAAALAVPQIHVQQPVEWKHLSTAAGDLPLPNRNLGDLKFEENLIDPRYSFSRAAADGLIDNSDRPQVVFVVGDGNEPRSGSSWSRAPGWPANWQTSASGTDSRSPKRNQSSYTPVEGIRGRIRKQFFTQDFFNGMGD
jgi:hypothetical protein